ncbi:MAG: type 1 glutamine amidotransferase [Salinibacter sp.]
MHLALIDASLGTPHAKRNFQREVDATLTIYDANEGDMPPPIGSPAPIQTEAGPVQSFDGAIISGSQSSVYDDHRPWIRTLSRWTEGAIADGLPILGVCWGHQLLAQILGGTVRGGSYELGYVEVDQEEDDPIWEGLSNPFTAFATHSDHVVTMPPDARLLASNETGVQAFRYDQVYATQFHPEYDLQTATSMIHSKDLSDRALQRALDTCTEANVEAARPTRQIFDNFLVHTAATTTDAPSPTTNA